MVSKKAMRMAIDVALSIMLVFEMLIQFTGDLLHEVVGCAFFATVVLHIALSFSWVKKTAHKASEGTLKARHASLAVVGCLLGLSVMLLGISSIAISGLLESAGFVWPFGEYALWVTIHSVSAYALCALVVVHLAMHWAFLASVLRVPYDPSRRRAISTGANAVAALGVVALGVTALKATLPQANQTGQFERSDGNANSAESANSVAGSEGTNSSANTGTSATDNIQDTPSAGAPQGKHRGRKGRHDDTVASGDAAAAGDAATPSSDAGDQGSTGSGGSSSNVCTLCRKGCSLDNPRCDKPYRTGLLG